MSRAVVVDQVRSSERSVSYVPRDSILCWQTELLAARRLRLARLPGTKTATSDWIDEKDWFDWRCDK